MTQDDAGTVTQDGAVTATQDDAGTVTRDGAGTATQDSVVTAWREMSACHAAACAALERELGERHGLGISDFEGLERLAAGGGRKFPSQDPAASVQFHHR